MSDEQAKQQQNASPAVEEQQPAPPEPPVRRPIDPAKTKQARELTHSCPFLGCRIDPLGRFVFASAQDFSVQRWQLDGEKKTALAGHDSWVRAMAFVDDGQTLVTAGYEGRLVWWPAADEAPKPLRKIDDAHSGWIRAIAASPDGQILATCGNDHQVKLWTADGQPLATLAGHQHHVYNVAFHPAGMHLVSVDHFGHVKIWDVATWQLQRELHAAKLHKYDDTFRADIGGARSIAVSPDGIYLALGGITGVSNAFAGVGKAAVVLVDWEANTEARLLITKNGQQGTMWGLDFTADGTLAGICGGNGGQMMFWNPATEKPVHQLGIKSDGRDLSIHPHGTQLATCHFDNRVRLFDLIPRDA